LVVRRACTRQSRARPQRGLRARPCPAGRFRLACGSHPRGRSRSLDHAETGYFSLPSISEPTRRILLSDSGCRGAAPPFATPLFRLHLVGGGQSKLAGNRDERIHRRVVFFDSFQTSLREIHGRCGLAAQQLGCFSQRQRREILRFTEGRCERTCGGCNAGSETWLRLP
jgi:hypothetical protein